MVDRRGTRGYWQNKLQKDSSVTFEVRFEWHEVVKSNLAMVRERKHQLRRIWKLKRKRYQFLALHIWRLGVQQNCRECGTKLRGKFVPKQVALAQMQNNKKVDEIDWSHREKSWDSRLSLGIVLGVDCLVTLTSCPRYDLH